MEDGFVLFYGWLLVHGILTLQNTYNIRWVVSKVPVYSMRSQLRQRCLATRWLCRCRSSP